MENEIQNKGSKKKKLTIIFSIVGVIAISAISYFIHLGSFVTTDNAQLDADIIPIKSSVSGYIQSIYFQDNQEVKKGDLLFTIDDTELKTKVAQAEAALENAKANLKSVRSNRKATYQNADAASQSTETIEQNSRAAKAKLRKAKVDYKRTKNMFAAKAVSQAELDNAEADLEVAQAQYDATISQNKSSSSQTQGVKSLAQAQDAITSLSEALIKQKEAELILAKTQLAYAQIKAPADGVVSRRSVEVGQYITIGQPLCSTIDNINLWIASNFKETQISKLKIGQRVDIKIDAYPDLKLTGKVASFIGATGAKFSLLPPDNSTGNFVKIVQRVPVKISIDALPKTVRQKLFPGLSAFVSVNVK